LFGIVYFLIHRNLKMPVISRTLDPDIAIQLPAHTCSSGPNWTSDAVKFCNPTAVTLMAMGGPLLLFTSQLIAHGTGGT
jgi:hypothetical protein